MISNLCGLSWYIAKIQTVFPLRQQGKKPPADWSHTHEKAASA